MDLTVCTTHYVSPRLPTPVLVRSCERWGVDLKVFGGAHRFDTFYRTKILGMRQFLLSCTSRYVLFLDASDTFFTKPLEELFAAYQKITNQRVVIGSELVCWPHRSLRRLLRRQAEASGSKSPFCFLDTGLILGPTKVVRKTLARLSRALPAWRRELSATTSNAIIEDDVGMWSLGIRDGIIQPIIDYDCKLIVAMRQLKLEDYEISRGHLKVVATGTEPAIVHCNGQRTRDRKTLRRVYKIITGERPKAEKVRVGYA